MAAGALPSGALGRSNILLGLGRLFAVLFERFTVSG
jgi:hypothetical protein